MRIVGLFAGIGGLELGFEAAGHETIALCEQWGPARAVLSARYPDVLIEPDVTDLESLPGETEALLAGFPCQDLSQAGLTAGIRGSRSSLVSHVFRLLDTCQVPWVVLENVSFMLHLDKGRALRTLVDALEERGYRWAYRVVNSLAFLPQRRERVLLLGTNTSVDPADVLFADDAEIPTPSTTLTTHAHGFYWTEGTRGLGWAPDAVPTLKNGSSVGIASPPAILLPNGQIVTPDIRDAERLQGFPADWTVPAETAGRRSLRWSLVGNATTVPVAEWLGMRLSSPGKHELHRDNHHGKDDRWPKAARFDGDRRCRVEIGAHPIWKERLPLAEFLRHEGKPLSARATRGFLGRTTRSKLRFVPGFLDRIADHLHQMEGRSSSGVATATDSPVAAE